VRVNASHKISKVNSIHSIFGLVLLLLLSPCKVKNFIQLELGIPKTVVANKSKTTVNNSTCSSYDIGTVALVNKESQPQPTPIVSYHPDFVASSFDSNFSLSYQVKNHWASSIPLYILYQNFKDYL